MRIPAEIPGNIGNGAGNRGMVYRLCDDERIYSRIMDINDVIIGKIGTCVCKDEQIEAAPVS